MQTGTAAPNLQREGPESNATKHKKTHTRIEHFRAAAPFFGRARTRRLLWRMSCIALGSVVEEGPTPPPPAAQQRVE
jgi:hypothetical protein